MMSVSMSVAWCHEYGLKLCTDFLQRVLEASWNVTAHAQKPNFFFQRNGRVHLNRRGRQFSRLPAAEVCASAVVMLDTPCSEIVWRVLATHSIRQFPFHFPSRASPCSITFHLESTVYPDSSDVRGFTCFMTSKIWCYIRLYLYCLNSCVFWICFGSCNKNSGTLWFELSYTLWSPKCIFLFPFLICHDVTLLQIQ